MNASIIPELIVNLVLFAVIFPIVLWKYPKMTEKPVVNSVSLLYPIPYVIVILVLCWRFLTPNTIYPPAWGILITILIGIGLSLPVILNNDYERRPDGKNYAKPNRMFLISLAFLFIFKLLTVIVMQHADETTSAFLVYVLVASYFIPWRLGVWLQYRRFSY